MEALVPVLVVIYSTIIGAFIVNLIINVAKKR